MTPALRLVPRPAETRERRRCPCRCLRSAWLPCRGDGGGRWRSRARSSGAALPASICRAGTATWRNAPGSPWPPSRSGSAPRSRRSIPRRPRNSPPTPPISTRFRAGGSVLASASRTVRCTSASASRRVSRSATPAHLSRSCAPIRGSARCRRSCSPRCASAWWRSPARLPRASCLPMPAGRTSRVRSRHSPKESVPTPIL